ncbi:MAG: hypothetical protein HY471_03175 [Candidatus Sungbacteria bacterium]|nr:hypothetical protein [Candidatus Sungbacteria bacterium]
MRVSKVWDAADGSGTPGRVFTASIAQERIPQDGAQLDFLTMGVKGAVSTAAVVIEDFADLINPFTFRVGGDNRVICTLQELCALMVFYYGKVPSIGENTDATGNNFIGGLKIPVYQKSDPTRDFLVQADRSAVTNIATETVSLTAYFDMGVTDKKPVHAVRVAHTSAGSAGLETLGFRIVPQGKMIGLIIQEPNGFTDGNIDTSVQRVKLLVEGKEMFHFNDLGDAWDGGQTDYVTPSPLADLLRPYRTFDLRPAGLDVKGQQVVVQLDVQDVSDALVIIPVIEVE